MQPEYRIEGRVLDICHVTSISSDKDVDPVVHVFYAVILTTAVVAVRRVRKWRIIRLRCNELISQCVKSTFLAQEMAGFNILTYEALLAINC